MFISIPVHFLHVLVVLVDHIFNSIANLLGEMIPFLFVFGSSKHYYSNYYIFTILLIYIILSYHIYVICPKPKRSMLTKLLGSKLLEKSFRLPKRRPCSMLPGLGSVWVPILSCRSTQGGGFQVYQWTLGRIFGFPHHELHHEDHWRIRFGYELSRHPRISSP